MHAQGSTRENAYLKFFKKERPAIKRFLGNNQSLRNNRLIHREIDLILGSIKIGHREVRK